MTDPDKTFEICYSGGTNIKVREVWPDGDAPENPTAEDVMKRMKESCKGVKADLLMDWNLAGDLDISVIDYKVGRAHWDE